MGGFFLSENSEFFVEMPFDSLAGHASRIRERVIDTGSLSTETRSEAFGTKAMIDGNGATPSYK